MREQLQLILILIVSVTVQIFLSQIIKKQANKKLNEKLSSLNENIEDLNQVTEDVNNYFDSQVKDLTQQVVDTNNLPVEKKQQKTTEENSLEKKLTETNKSDTQGISSKDSSKDFTSGDATNIQSVIPGQQNQSSMTCYIRNQTTTNSNFLQNSNNMQKTISNYLDVLNFNYVNKNLLPIGSIIYSAYPLQETYVSFVYGPYKLQSIIQYENISGEEDYGKQVGTYTLETNSSNVVNYKIPNALNRTLMGTDLFNQSHTQYDDNNKDLEYSEIEKNNTINVAKEIAGHQHSAFSNHEIESVYRRQSTFGRSGGLVGSKDDANYRYKDNKVSDKITHGHSSKQEGQYEFRFKVLDQRVKVYLYLILGYVK